MNNYDELEFELLDEYGSDFIDMMESVRNQFLKSFVWNEENLDNRFNRYMKQFKIEMFEAVKKSNLLFSIIFNDMKITNIEDYIYMNLGVLVYKLNDLKMDDTVTEDDFEEELQYELCSLNLVRCPDYKNNEELILQQLSDNRDVIGKLMNKYFIQTCEDIIALKSSLDEDITQYNFLKMTLPQTEEEYLKYYNDIYYAVAMEFDTIITTNENMDEKLLKNEKILKQTLEEKEEKIQNLEKTLEEQETRIQKLREMQEQTLEEKNRVVKNAVVAYQQENAELNKKIRMLEKELEISKKKETVVEEIMEETEEIANVDIDWNTLKILFVSSDSSTFANDLQNSFPSSKMVYDNFKVNLSKYDCVMVITSHIDHPTYQTFKQKCVVSGTKFLHCPNTNVEKIKEIISGNWKGKMEE